VRVFCIELMIFSFGGKYTVANEEKCEYQYPNFCKLWDII